MRFNRAAPPAPEIEQAPDYAEPVLAWRAWDVVVHDDRLALRSLFFPTLWPRRRALYATCDRRSLVRLLRRGRETHPAPQERCECGIYACRLDVLADYLSEPPPLGVAPLQRVAGIVSLWGDVLECERGWRGSVAYPASIFVSTSPLISRHRKAPRELATGLDVYGVPVHVVHAEGPEQFLEALACEPLSIGGVR